MNEPHVLQYDVVAIGANGAVHSARVQAPNEQQAAQQLALGGARVLSCRSVTAGRWHPSALLPRRSRLSIELFTEELAALLDAGLGMVDAIRTLALKERDRSARSAIERVATDITQGQPLSQALASQPACFPPLLIAAVAASEQTGDLVAAMRRYAAHLETLSALRGKVIGAAVYPALLLGVGTLVVLFLLGVVVPRFAQLFEGAHRDLPAASSMILGWGKLVAEHPWLFSGALLIAGGVLAALVLRALRSGGQIPGLQRIWIIGPLIRTFRHSQFFRTSSMLVEAGIPALRAFRMARPLLTPADQAQLDVAAEAIAQGQRIGGALSAAGIADAVALRMLEVAQRTGRLHEVLGRIAQFQEAHLARAVNVASRLIEPALMIFIGLVIGSIVVLMYLPIFDLAANLE